MAADDFTLTPNWVDIITPEYPVVITQSETYKKDYQILGTPEPIERFRLRFEGLTDANYETLYDHYMGRYGGYDDFAWKAANIPSYINDICDLGGADLAGRWVDGSLRSTPYANHWDAEIIFERSI